MTRKEALISQFVDVEVKLQELVRAKHATSRRIEGATADDMDLHAHMRHYFKLQIDQIKLLSARKDVMSLAITEGFDARELSDIALARLAPDINF